MVEGGGSADHALSKRWAFGDPQSFQRLIDLLVDSIAGYLEQQIAAGVEAVQLFDSWAGVLPEPAFRRWCLEPVAAIVRRLRQRHPTVPIIAFPRGAGLLHQGFAAATGVAGLSLDSTVPVDWAARELQGDACLQGNLDPQMLVVGGRPMRQEAARILAALGRGPFIFNLGHGIVPATPPGHVGALVDQVRRWRSG
jgi:uroporphyrinogen decarboxylase